MAELNTELNMGNYSPANWVDAEETRPAAATFDIGGNGGTTPYSSAINAIVSKHMDEIKAKSMAVANLPTGWKKRLRDFITTKNADLLGFLNATVPNHPVLGPAEILLRRFGNPMIHPSHASVRDIVLDVSGTNHMPDLNEALNLIMNSESGLRGHGKCTEFLYEQYRATGDEILKLHASLKLKLETLDRIQNRITGLFEIDTNDQYAPLMEASEAYLAKVFHDNQIDTEYKRLIDAYRRFIAVKDSVQLLRAQSSIENEPMCSICLNEAVSFAMSPCGHTFCQTCMRRQGAQCPMCRAQIKDRVKLFFG